MDDRFATPTPGPGWYPEPYADGWLRWWDGSAWGDARSALGPVAPTGQGFRSVGNFLGSSFRAVLAAWKPLGLLAAIAVVPLIIGFALADAQLGFSDWLADVNESFADTPAGETPDLPAWDGNVALAWVWGAVLVLLYLVAYAVLPLAAVPIVDARLMGTTADLDLAVRAGLRAVPRAIVLGLVVLAALLVALLVTVALFFVAPLLGALAMLTFFVVGVYVWVRSLGFWHPLVVIEGLSVDAIRRSWDLTEGRFWALFGRLILFTILVGIASNAVTLPFQFLAPSNIGLAALLSGSVSAAVGAASGIVTVSGETVLYRELVGGPPTPPVTVS